MKVAELVDKLREFDPDLEVMVDGYFANPRNISALRLCDKADGRAKWQKHCGRYLLVRLDWNGEGGAK